jgi:hypothetical protein
MSVLAYISAAGDLAEIDTLREQPGGRGGRPALVA